MTRTSPSSDPLAAGGADDEMGYADALAELEAILDELDGDEVDVDVLGARVRRAAELLRTDGALAIEHDEEHAEAVPELLRADSRFDRIDRHADLTGRPRFTTARRRAQRTGRSDGTVAWQTGSS